MSSDIKERLRDGWSSELRHAAIARIEALEGEVADLKKLVKILHDDASVSLAGKRAAEARAERLRVALATIGEGIRDGQHCALIANTALEDDKQ